MYIDKSSYLQQFLWGVRHYNRLDLKEFSNKNGQIFQVWDNLREIMRAIPI